MRLTIRRKLIISFLVIVVLTAVVGYAGVSAASQISSMIDEMYNNQTLSIKIAKDAQVNLYKFAPPFATP
jgi:predicted PurR-regulated permease PerM